MRYSICRECEFEIMEECLRSNDSIYLYNKNLMYYKYIRCHLPYHRNGGLIKVYLEDYVQDSEGGFRLLLDFFSIVDYVQYINFFDERNELDDNDIVAFSRSTFFQISNYKTDDELEKGAHYRLDLKALRERRVSSEHGKDIDGFPLLYDITLSQENQTDFSTPLLYRTEPLIYPQWVFSNLHSPITLPEITFGASLELCVRNVGQGNFNEIILNGNPYIIFDAGTEVLNIGMVPFHSLRNLLQAELDRIDLPLFVLSHWHADHYSLLFAQNEQTLKKLKYCIFPSYVKNLSVFNFIMKLKSLGVIVNMTTLPAVKKWNKHVLSGDGRIILYANKLVKSNTNNSGLTLFVQGSSNNVMMPGDCYYRIAESQANDAIKNPMNNGIHYLVIPHHCGHAGKVSYKIANACNIEGIVSVGHNNYGHPNPMVQGEINQFVNPLEMTSLLKRDIIKEL